ncbi:hypothetical protein WBG78_19250 [Chryseolinea sp. T2]|uniref:hypothetical protein n=1 Tax=Chryseolinea sp. T2 TaxID=3129255 RepID=UPI003076E220
MKRIIAFTLLFFLTTIAWTDVAPNPITLKGIIPARPCEVRMLSEVVEIDMHADSSFLHCTFNMVNTGDSLTLPVGFPVMTLFHWNMYLYDLHDREAFEIYVDGVKLDRDDIQVPEEMKPAYDRFVRGAWADEEFKRKSDSLDNHYGVKPGTDKVTRGTDAAYQSGYNKIQRWFDKQPHLDFKLYDELDSLLKNGNYAWYVWPVKFNKAESKTITVNYTVEAGSTYGGHSRFVKYLLSTGAGWYDNIGRADIIVKLHGIEVSTVEAISPANHQFDKVNKTISWTFSNLEPTINDDIDIQYYNPNERKSFEKHMRKKGRMIRRNQ